MGSIELKMAILTGLVGGVIMVLAEAVALHRKLSAEICGIAVVVLVQPVIVTWLVLSALDNFNPEFSAHVMAELHQGIQHGNLNDSRTLRAPPD